MATNLKLQDRYAQRRDVSVGVYDLTEADILSTDGAAVANIPANSLVLSAYVVVTTKSTTASASVSVTVGGTAFATNSSVTTEAVVKTDTPKYFATGGELVAKAGATAPAAGDLVLTLVVQYIQLDKVNGEYTDVA